MGANRAAPASNICPALATVLGGKESAQAVAAATVAASRECLARTIARWGNDGAARFRAVRGRLGCLGLSKRPSFLGLPARGPGRRWVRRG